MEKELGDNFPLDGHTNFQIAMTVRTTETGGNRQPIMAKTEDGKWEPNAKMLYI